MTIEDTKILIASDDSKTLEQKKRTGELEEGMQVTCAILNTCGGCLILEIITKSMKIVDLEIAIATLLSLIGIEQGYGIQSFYVDVPNQSKLSLSISMVGNLGKNRIINQ